MIPGHPLITEVSAEFLGGTKVAACECGVVFAWDGYVDHYARHLLAVAWDQGWAEGFLRSTTGDLRKYNPYTTDWDEED